MSENREELKLNEAAAEINNLVRQQLLSVMPYLSRALLKMPLSFLQSDDDFFHRRAKTQKSEGIGTDGLKIFTSPEFIVDEFESGYRYHRCYLHMILHCVFLHPFRYDKLDAPLWDFASDIAIESVISDLSVEFLTDKEDSNRKEILRQIKYDLGEIHAESVYSELKKKSDFYDKYIQYRDLFHFDNHRYWSVGSKKITDMTVTDRGSDDDIDNKEREWTEMYNNTRIAVEVHSKKYGDEAGSLVKTVRGLYGDDRDYSDFLKKFAVLCEEVKINKEEFDYIYYTLGLEMYGDMPLIEPLEYRESKKIRELVIAIDTSGSCQGRSVRMFLARTYSILKSTSGFFDTVNVHIVQCDSKVQRVKVIHRLEELEQYMTDIEIVGSGGTNFIPVFEYIDEEINKGNFQDLKGLLYFTDGIGAFPEKEPEYLTAFILPEYRIEEPQIPSWAMRLEMRNDGVV